MNAQIAKFIPDWNKVNSDYKAGKMSQKEYDAWLESILRIFNVPINDFLYPHKKKYIFCCQIVVMNSLSEPFLANCSFIFPTASRHQKSPRNQSF